MQHLDEGILMALLDGELKGPEQQEAENHLRTCLECSARFDELKSFMREADGLVADLGEPPALPADRSIEPVRQPRRFTPRTLAWAASVVAALGLGYAGSTLLDSGIQGTNLAGRDMEQKASEPVTASAPQSAPPPELTLQEERARQPSAGNAAGSRDTAGDPGPESDNARLLRNQALAVRPNVGEAGQAAAESVDLSAGGVGAVRDAATPTDEVAAKATETERVQAETAARSRALEGREDRQFAPAVPPAPTASAGFRREGFAAPVFHRITMEEAVRHLSGAIRLIDGLAPEEFEVAASDSAQSLVRVIYRVGPAETRLVLEQRRVGNSFVASDLQTLQMSVAPATTGNRLSWNDLRGFALTLSGSFSPDSLFHFKTLVK